MPSPIYMWIENEQGNAVEGSVDMTDERGGSIEVLELSHSIEIPTDTHTGSLNGMRRHNAVNIVKKIDKSSTALFNTVTTGKTLNKVTLRFYNISHDGVEQEYYRIDFDNAKVTSFVTSVDNVKNPNSDLLPHLEKIAMRYEKMTVTYADGNLTASDSWKERSGKIA